MVTTVGRAILAVAPVIGAFQPTVRPPEMNPVAMPVGRLVFRWRPPPCPGTAVTKVAYLRCGGW